MPTVETPEDFLRRLDGYYFSQKPGQVTEREAAIRRDELARVVKRLRDEADRSEARGDEAHREAHEQKQCGRNFAVAFASANGAMLHAKLMRVAADLLEREGAGT